MWFRIQDNVAVEQTDSDPAGRYNPALVWQQGTPETKVGDLWNGSAFHAPTVPAPSAIRIISGTEFLALWTPAEVAATQASDPTLNYAMLRVIMQNRVNLDSAELPGLLALAVSKGGITASRAADIKANIPPGGASHA